MLDVDCEPIVGSYWMDLWTDPVDRITLQEIPQLTCTVSPATLLPAGSAVDAVVIPAPGAWLLMSCALLALAGVRRRV